MFKTTLVLLLISASHIFAESGLFVKKQPMCPLLNSNECDWNGVMDKYNNVFPSETYNDNNDEIICVNSGYWPEHSRSPCDIGKTNQGVVEQIFVENCKKSLKTDNKLRCKFNLKYLSTTSKEAGGFSIYSQ